MSDKYDSLKLENQLCFPLYSASREITRTYQPFLEKIHLTYTQYITMMVLWEHESLNVKSLGKYLLLDSGTLTPLLKKLEDKDLIVRKRNKEDERNLIIELTDKGRELKEEALFVPQSIIAKLNLSQEEAIFLYKILYKIIQQLQECANKN